MRRSLFVALPFVAAACLGPPPQAPEPLNLQSPRPVRDVVQTATVTLVGAGFNVVQTDSVGRSIVASRIAGGNGNEPFISCLLPRNSAGAANRESTIRIAFTASPSNDGSGITIESTVKTTYPGYDGTPMALATDETECVSNGTMERRLADALR
jgi:hypothetical protein